jgi:hypothetical protein
MFVMAAQARTENGLVELESRFGGNDEMTVLQIFPHATEHRPLRR